VFRLPSLGTPYLSQVFSTQFRFNQPFYRICTEQKGITQHRGNTENGFRDVS
jgi:hypothetical protein